nr:branched-chain amino acid ABC transporter permease [Galbitalea soli]
MVNGSVYALLGLCLVATYRTSGVLNFAQTAVGAFAALTAVDLIGTGMPTWVAWLIAIAVGTVVSVLLGLMLYRWFSQTGARIKTSATIAALLALLAIGDRVFGDTPRSFVDPFSLFGFTLWGVRFTGDTIIALGAAVVLTIALDVMLRRTRTGHRLRAVAGRPLTAELLGLPVLALTIIVWTFVGVVGSASILIIAPTASSTFTGLSLLVLPATAAALFGGFESLWLTLVGGLLLGMISGLTSYFAVIAPYNATLQLAFVTLILIFKQRGERWDEAR